MDLENNVEENMLQDTALYYSLCDIIIIVHVTSLIHKTLFAFIDTYKINKSIKVYTGFTLNKFMEEVEQH